jgi:hypothetical protein
MDNSGQRAPNKLKRNLEAAKVCLGDGAARASLEQIQR